MKKRIISMLLAALTLIPIGFVNTQDAHAMDRVNVIVNGRTIVFPDAPAYIDRNGRTQIPMRYIGEALGAEVEWDAGSRRATFSLEIEGANRYVDFYIGSSSFYIKNPPQYRAERQTMDTVAVIENNRTYVPARYVAEALGATVRWESSTRTVYVISSSSSSSQGTEQEPKDEIQYDRHGLMLAQYANAYYQKWYETLRVTYEGNRVFLSYTIPTELPENTELRIAFTCVRIDEKKSDGPGWMYQSFVLVDGDTEDEYDYLLPNPISGDVRKELKFIPFEDIHYIYISCNFVTPRSGTRAETKRYAQSSYRVNINPRNLKESELRILSYDWWHVEIGRSIVDIDGATIVIFK